MTRLCTPKYRGKQSAGKAQLGSRQLWLWTAERWHRLMDSVADGVAGVVDDGGECCRTDCWNCGDYGRSGVGDRSGYSGGVWHWSRDSSVWYWGYNLSYGGSSVSEGSRVCDGRDNGCSEGLSGSRGLYVQATAATVVSVGGYRHAVGCYTVTSSVSDVVSAEYVSIGVDVAEAADFVSVDILLTYKQLSMVFLFSWNVL